MNTPSQKPKIPINNFLWGVLISAILAGVAICDNPTWPVVIGILGLCVLVIQVLRYAWTRDLLEVEQDSTIAAQRKDIEENA